MPVIDVGYDQNAPEFSLVPEGAYDFRVKSIDVKPGPNYSQFEVKSEVVFSDVAPATVGRTVTDWFSHSPKASKILKRWLDAMDVQYQIIPNPAGGEFLRFDTDHCIGRSFRARCKHGTATQGARAGQPREEWGFYEPSSYGRSPGQQPIPQAPGMMPQQGYAPQAMPAQGYPPQPGYPQPQQMPGQGAPPPAAQPQQMPGQPGMVAVPPGTLPQR